MEKTFKFIAFAFGIIFLGFTAVQYNDPDRSLWMFIYLVAAAVSFSAFSGRHDKLILASILVVSIFGAFELFPYGHFEGVSLKHGMKTMEIELARESFGFGIVAIASVIFLISSFRKQNA